MVFHEWTKNKEIDNDKLTLKETNNKLIEEVVEVIEASTFYEDKPTEETLIHALEEILDVAQLLFNRLRRLRRLARINLINYENCFFSAKLRHDEKRRKRGWECGYYEYKIRRNTKSKDTRED